MIKERHDVRSTVTNKLDVKSGIELGRIQRRDIDVNNDSKELVQ